MRGDSLKMLTARFKNHFWCTPTSDSSCPEDTIATRNNPYSKFQSHRAYLLS